MSPALYDWLVFWDGRKGCVRRAGATLPLAAAPCVPGLSGWSELHCAPEVRSWRIRDEFGGWRDMEAREVEAVTRYLNEGDPC